MIERLRNSWTYRSAALYRRLVRWRPIPVGPKPTQDLLYLTLGGAAGWLWYLARLADHE